MFKQIETAEADRDYWREEARKFEDELRSLRFQYNSQWEKEIPAQETINTSPIMWFSAQARKSFGEMDSSAQATFYKQVLEKLFDEELRSAQSEPEQTAEGVFFAYPRKRSAGGRRVIYILDGENIKICELFAHHDTYQKARDKGIDLAQYAEFIALEDIYIPA